MPPFVDGWYVADPSVADLETFELSCSVGEWVRDPEHGPLVAYRFGDCDAPNVVTVGFAFEAGVEPTPGVVCASFVSAYLGEGVWGGSQDPGGEYPHNKWFIFEGDTEIGEAQPGSWGEGWHAWEYGCVIDFHAKADFERFGLPTPHGPSAPSGIAR